jgi:phosphonate transport system ATP-binding protein
VTSGMTDLISPVVVLDQVSKLFAGRRALDRVSLAIEPGEFVAVIGRSGAGKTTFLRCLTRALSVSDGMIRFGNEDLGELNGRGLREHRARVGMIHQQFNLVKRLRVLDNVLIGRVGRARGGSGEQVVRVGALPEKRGQSLPDT